LDVGLPDGNGFDVCVEIRVNTDAHILFLTANVEQEDVFHGFSCGGDDYITKPFHVRELLLRVQAAMRRRQISISQKTISKGSLTLNLVSNAAFADGNDLLLSQKEFSILRLLVENEGKNLQAEYLFGELWGQQTIYNNNTLRNHIYELRKKLNDGNCHYTIGAKYRKGYYLERLAGT
jgi:DNA-binding response OmpR family regulator